MAHLLEVGSDMVTFQAVAKHLDPKLREQLLMVEDFDNYKRMMMVAVSQHARSEATAAPI